MVDPMASWSNEQCGQLRLDLEWNFKIRVMKNCGTGHQYLKKQHSFYREADSENTNRSEESGKKELKKVKSQSS